MRQIYDKYLVHYGIKGMQRGKRRWTNADGSLNEAGKERYNLKKSGYKPPSPKNTVENKENRGRPSSSDLGQGRGPLEWGYDKRRKVARDSLEAQRLTNVTNVQANYEENKKTIKGDFGATARDRIKTKTMRKASYDVAQVRKKGKKVVDELMHKLNRTFTKK